MARIKELEDFIATESEVNALALTATAFVDPEDAALVLGMLEAKTAEMGMKMADLKFMQLALEAHDRIVAEEQKNAGELH